MVLMGAEPLYNSNEIIPAKIRIVPAVAANQAQMRFQQKMPAAMKTAIKTGIMSQ